MFEIVGVYDGTEEVVDTAEDLTEARYLVGEYQMAFGSDWRIYHREAKED